MSGQGISRPIPELPDNCNSWVAVFRSTGQPVMETFDYQTARAVNQANYEVLTALEWLRRFNRNVRSVQS